MAKIIQVFELGNGNALELHESRLTDGSCVYSININTILGEGPEGVLGSARAKRDADQCFSVIAKAIRDYCV